MEQPRIITLRGGVPYVTIAERLRWLRTQHPDATIETVALSLTETAAVFRATVTVPGGGSATGHGSETAKDFPDFIEKAETKALGRALAHLGFGTLDALEAAEGEAVSADPETGEIASSTLVAEQEAWSPEAQPWVRHVLRARSREALDRVYQAMPAPVRGLPAMARLIEARQQELR